MFFYFGNITSNQGATYCLKFLDKCESECGYILNKLGENLSKLGVNAKEIQLKYQDKILAANSPSLQLLWEMDLEKKHKILGLLAK